MVKFKFSEFACCVSPSSFELLSRHFALFVPNSTGSLKTPVSGKPLNSNALTLKASLCLLSASEGDRECVRELEWAFALALICQAALAAEGTQHVQGWAWTEFFRACRSDGVANSGDGDGQFAEALWAFKQSGSTALHLCPLLPYQKNNTHARTHTVLVLRATLHLKSVAMVTTATPWRQQREADWEGREGKVALEREADGRYGKGTFGTRECRKHQRMCSGGGWRWREPGGRGEKNRNWRSGVRQQRV